MLYSQDINKVCALCEHADAATGSDTHIKCAVHNEYRAKSDSCKHFVYDIFKKQTRRPKRRQKTYSADDFKL